MNFLKNFFNDDSTIIGLCSFGITRPKSTSPIENEIFFNPFQGGKHYETNFKNNVFLSV